jgi:hypothetical protein
MGSRREKFANRAVRVLRRTRKRSGESAKLLAKALAESTPTLKSDVLNDYEKNVWSRVDGWLSNVGFWMMSILLQAQRNSGVSGDAVEIGCWEGRTLLLLQRLLSEEELVMGYDIELRDQLHRNLDRFRHEGGASVKLRRVDSRGLLSTEILDDSPLGVRVFHVDGYHTLEMAQNDMELAFATTKRGGIVIVDDFFSVTVPGVTEAYFKLSMDGRTKEFQPFATGGGKLFLSTPDAILNYKRSLFSLMPLASLNSTDVSFLSGNEIAIYELGSHS